MYRCGYVALVGRPNAGKSTLINAIVGEKVSIVSQKAGTTRDKIMGIYNSSESQIVFLDTPGLLKPKNKLDEYMLTSINASLDNIDCILFVVDISKGVTQEDINLIESYKNVPLIVVINKIDKLKREALFEALNKLNNIDVSAIVPVSAYKKQNIKELITEIEKYLTDSIKYFDDDEYTDKSLNFQISELIREKTLWFLNEEVPLSIAIELLDVNLNSNVASISANIICEKESHKKIIVGTKGNMIKNIGSQCRTALEKMIGKKVYLELFVKVKENWKSEETLLNNLGYNKKIIN